MNQPPHPPPTFGDLLAGLGTWVLLASVAWGALIGAAAVVETVTDGRLRATAWVGCPVRLRRTLLVTLGLVLAGAGPAGAGAASGETPSGTARTPVAGGLPAPARPLGRGVGRGVGSAMAGGPGSVVVRHGDTLWHLAAARLRPGAGASQILDHVAGLHHANRAVIGCDPDLIHPGQRLTLPRPLAAADPAASRPHEETR